MTRVARGRDVRPGHPASPGIGTFRPRLVVPARVAARRADGSLICLSELPAPGARWTRRRKQAVVECVEHDLVTPAAVCLRYDLSHEELDEWRATARNGMAPAVWPARPRPAAGTRVRAGRLSVDLVAGVAGVDGVPVPLSPSEWRLLAALAEAGGNVVTTAMLMDVLYGDASRVAGSKIADVLIFRLRRRLGVAAERIEAAWGRGYALAVD